MLNVASHRAEDRHPAYLSQGSCHYHRGLQLLDAPPPWYLHCQTAWISYNQLSNLDQTQYLPWNRQECGLLYSVSMCIMYIDDKLQRLWMAFEYILALLLWFWRPSDWTSHLAFPPNVVLRQICSSQHWNRHGQTSGHGASFLRHPHVESHGWCKIGIIPIIWLSTGYCKTNPPG